jgi:fused signal recognition particle receptor
MAKHRASRKNPPQYRSEPAYAKRAAAVTGAALAMTVVGTLAGTPSEAPSQAAAEGIYPSLNLPTAQSVTPLGVPIVKKATKKAPLAPRFEDRLRAAMNQGVADAELRATSVDRTRSRSGGPRRSTTHALPRSEATTPRAVPSAGSGVTPGAREELGAADARRSAGAGTAETGGAAAPRTRKTPCPPTTTVPVHPPVVEKPEPTAEPAPTPVTKPEPEPEREAPQPAPVNVPAPDVEEVPVVETPVVSDVESTVGDTLDMPKDGES